MQELVFMFEKTFQARIRFHIDTLLGQRSEQDPLPAPASPEQRQAWMREKEILSDQPVELLDTSEAVDPCFPYPDGPGHQDASPQQLLIMWKMMKSVGVSSF